MNRLRMVRTVAVAMPVLMTAEHAHRLHEMQVLFGACHRNVERPALFLDLLASANGHV
jgi:hypothetical protein